MNRVRNLSVLAMVILVAAGCGSGATTRQPPAPSAPKLRELPLEMTVKQRTTMVVPGSDQSLQLAIDDIKLGHVVVYMLDKDGKGLTRSWLTAGESATFRHGDETYQLTLKEVNNALVGEDFATFTISSSEESSTISEHAKIERLLSAVEAAEGDVFIRNGSEHSSKDAADHLRTKWKAAGGKIATADQFIDEIASTSSLSDQPYRVRQADGREVSANDYLRNKLSQIEAGDHNSL